MTLDQKVVDRGRTHSVASLSQKVVPALWEYQGRVGRLRGHSGAAPRKRLPVPQGRGGRGARRQPSGGEETEPGDEATDPPVVRARGATSHSRHWAILALTDDSLGSAHLHG